ncbi:MAG: PucR family transcriptional regulator [Coprococcus sp.]
MAYNQMLQSTIEGVKAITRTDLCLLDTEGNVIAATNSDAQQYRESVLTFVSSPAEIQVVQGYQYFKIMDAGSLEYVMLIRGDSDDIYTIGKLVAFQIQNLLSAYKEKYDKENFIKNVLLDNMLLVDIYNKAKKLHINAEARRLVFVIETNRSRDNNAMEIIKSLFTGKSGDYITAVDEASIILVKELAEKDSYKEMHVLARTIVDLLNTEAMSNAKIAYGTIVNNIKDISRSYNEAKMALDVGKIFYDEKSVVAYNRLGIGRLIYQLPIPLCKMFIDEIFPGTTPDEFDDETLLTIRKFFENSLNVSETARQLYIHRNTLVYRLDKVNKATGLDLRVFEDAITFEIALMVVRYMHYMESKEY